MRIGPGGRGVDTAARSCPAPRAPRTTRLREPRAEMRIPDRWSRAVSTPCGCLLRAPLLAGSPAARTEGARRTWARCVSTLVRTSGGRMALMGYAKPAHIETHRPRRGPSEVAPLGHHPLRMRSVPSVSAQAEAAVVISKKKAAEVVRVSA